MEYDNITKENFNDYFEGFYNLLFQIDMFLFENDDLESNEHSNYEIMDCFYFIPKGSDRYRSFLDIFMDSNLSIIDRYKKVFDAVDLMFKHLFKFSHSNDIFFKYCSSKVYENTFENRFIDFENKFIDVQKIDFTKKEVENNLNSFVPRFKLFNNENQTILTNAKTKKFEFLQSISKDYNFNVIKKDSLDLLNFKMFKVEIKNNIPTTPKHENIFCNNGFVLFDHILNEYVKTNIGRLSDIHFFYRSMYDNKPQFIHQRPERFKEWFFENYNEEDLGKIKTYNDVKNPDRQIHYSNALNWFKLQNK
jgi:hypothetical protein